MRYVLIKRCRIVGVMEKNMDILIANNKIVEIGKNISRPTIDCEEIDAEGRMAVPGFVDICSSFINTVYNEKLAAKVYEDLSAGFTTWIGDVSPSNAVERLAQLSFQDPHTLNFSLHYNINAFHHGDLNKIKNTSEINGMPTLHYLMDEPKAAFNDRLDLYLATAAKNNMLLMVEINMHCHIEEHIRALNHFCKRIDGTGCRVMFVNVRYSEEFDVISKARGNNDVYVHLLYSPIIRNNYGLTEIEHNVFVELLRQNTWISGDIDDLPGEGETSYDGSGVREKFSRKHRVAVLGSLCEKDKLTVEEMVEYMTERKCRLLGLWPEKGQIAVGSDADICLVNDNKHDMISLESGGEKVVLELHNSVDYVLMSGRIVYDKGELRLNNIQGKQVFRRYI